MSGNASRSAEDLTDVSALKARLSRCRVEPEFTMQMVGNETDVPPETLRSWEKRYGFPVPGRAPSGHRRYSERDIVAVGWLREKTEQGQSISDAMTLLQRAIADPPAPVPLTPSITVTPPSPFLALTPVQTLADALIDGDMTAAQNAWDQLALAASPDALLSEVLLPAWSRLRDEVNNDVILVQAEAFLDRKTMVLFDRSAPDQGIAEVVVMTGGRDISSVPALSLATALSRAGYRVPLPPLDASSSATMAHLSHIAPTMPVILVTDATGTALLQTCRALLPSRRIFRWWPDDTGSDDALPARLRDVPAALHNDD